MKTNRLQRGVALGETQYCSLCLKPTPTKLSDMPGKEARKNNLTATDVAYPLSLLAPRLDSDLLNSCLQIGSSRENE
jgi:hypothetical protein